MRKFVCLCIVCCLTVQLSAQSDSVLVRIGDQKITRAEFETVYREHYPLTVYNEKHIRECLETFINNKLKIAEAKKMRLDTVAGFRLTEGTPRKELQVQQLVTSKMDDALLYEMDKKTDSLSRSEKLVVMQIFRYIPQNCSNGKLEEENGRMRAVYADLKADPQVDFEAYVEKYSEDKRRFEVGVLETVPEFEKTVFAMRAGEVSAPFVTAQGIHIVKVLERKEMKSQPEWKEKLQLRSMKKYKNGTEMAFVQKLKDNYGYRPDLNGINALLSNGYTDEALFTLNGRVYTGKDFSYFAEKTPKGIQRQLNDFIAKLLFECESERVVVNLPEPEVKVPEYTDEMLLAEINHREIKEKALNDRAGLDAYFAVHKKEYEWAQPRFRGVVLHTRDKGIIPEAKKLVKKRPVEEWQTLITQFFNLGVVQQVEVEQGTFEMGENAFVDHLVFKRKAPVPLPTFPFTAVIGKKVQGPEQCGEVLEPLMRNYEKFLETRWMAQLRSTYKVEINEEVLKTVNNH